jgi:hypothetical protein
MTRYLRSLFVILFAALAVLGTIGSTQAAGGSGPPDAGSTLSTRAGIARLAREILRPNFRSVEINRLLHQWLIGHFKF